jgi:hypothetical protein
VRMTAWQRLMTARCKRNDRTKGNGRQRQTATSFLFVMAGDDGVWKTQPSQRTQNSCQTPTAPTMTTMRHNVKQLDKTMTSTAKINDSV